MTSATPERTVRYAPLASPALVACDIDGTLLRTGHHVTEAVRAAVAKVHDAGHHIVLATGRSLVGALPVAAQLGIDDAWIVASNGAITAHMDDSGYEVTDLHVVEPEPVVRLVLDAMPDMRIATEMIGLGYRVNRLFPSGELNGEQRQAWTLRGLWAQPTPRLAVHGPDAAGLVPVLRAMSLTAIATRPDWVDVTPPGLSKATALEKLREGLRVEPTDTAAIGDSDNDVEMLAWASRSIAMGHAPAHVQGVADRATGTIDEDGAAAALLSLLA